MSFCRVRPGQVTHEYVLGAVESKAGHKLYVSLAFSVVKDREGKVIGAMATAREFIEDKTRSQHPDGPPPTKDHGE